MQMRHKSGRLLVTGSSGFIGSHLCSSLLQSPDTEKSLYGIDLVQGSVLEKGAHYYADIRRQPELEKIARHADADALIHLAAKAEVQIPYSSYGELLSTNVEGTFNVLGAFQPRLFIFASTSSVYGNTPAGGGLPRWSHVNPLGIYGLSKSTGELICKEWARSTGGASVILRLGNVVGEECRGLIPYLVDHVRRYPDGSVAAELRGEGMLARDYVPVRHVVRIMREALVKEWKPGKSHVFNVGTGRGLTNREVVDIVRPVLESCDYRLRLNWNNPLAPGEAKTAVLDPVATERAFGIPTPSPAEVVEAIEDAVRSFLGRKEPCGS